MRSKKTVKKPVGARPSSSSGAKKTVSAHKNGKLPSAKKKPLPKKTYAKRKNSVITTLTPFILLAVSLLLETCFLLSEQSGAAGMLIHNLFFGLFGSVSHVIAIGLLLIAFFFKDLEQNGVLRYKLILFPILVTVLASVNTLAAQNGLSDAAFSFKEFWQTGTLAESGGVFGGVFGFLFSKLFGGIAATVITVIASVALASLCFGKTKLGVWRVFVRDKNGENAMRQQQHAAPAKPESAPTVAKAGAPKITEITVPRRIDTLLSSDTAESEPSAPQLAEPEQLIPELVGAAAENAPEYADGVQADGQLTDLDDFDDSLGEGDGLRSSYRPADLMEDFGFRAEQTKKAEKQDVYSEAPKTAPPKPIEAPRTAPTAPKKQESAEAPRGYSPFATIMSKEEFFSERNAKKTYNTPKKTTAPSGETVAYSPFSDPIASMNAPKRDTTDLPPQSYIAAGQEKMWEDMREQAQSIEDEQNAGRNDGTGRNDDTAIYDVFSKISTIECTPNGVSSEIPTAERTPNGVSSEIPLVEDTKNNASTAPTKDELYSSDPMADFAPAEKEKQSFSSAFPERPEPVQPSPVFTNEPKPTTAYAEPTTAQPVNSITPPAQPKIPVTSAPVTPERAVPVMPAENTHSAFDDDITAPEQEDEISRPVAEQEPERDPRVINPFSRYTKLRYPKYVKPPTSLLDEADNTKKISEEEVHAVMRKILDKFESFHVDVSITGYSAGPSITRYEVTPGPGVKYKQVTGLAEDIGLALQSDSIKGEVRIVTVPGKPVIGIEVPNSVVSKVSLRSLVENPDFQKAKSKITVCVGLTVSGKPVYMNIDDMPHVLVAGQTKSGKSVAINAMIMSIIYRASPDEVQFILVDPKQVELSIYNDIPHMVMPVIDDPKRAAGALQWAVAEMERRYTLIKNARVRDREEYYRTKDQNPDFEYMPQIIIIIDELADLMLQVREHVEEPINRLAAKARACGINLVIGTQRPSTDIVTGLIKANIPSKIAFRVASNVDSRVILGNVGAEKLLGRGDMLYHPTGGNQIRAQGAFVDTPEIKRVLDFIIENNGAVEYDPEILYRLQSETDKLNKTDKKSAIGGDDDFAVDTADIDFDYLCQAVELVINLGKATTNVIQRHLKIGFNRASNIVDKLEDLGFISKSNGSSKPRDVTVTMAEYLEWKNSHQK